MIIRGGWPDKIVDGVAIEEKSGADRVRKNQQLVHELVLPADGGLSID
jgi:hypothetical protein